jgi:hypothetical protein
MDGAAMLVARNSLGISTKSSRVSQPVRLCRRAPQYRDGGTHALQQAVPTFRLKAAGWLVDVLDAPAPGQADASRAAGGAGARHAGDEVEIAAPRR